MNLMEQFADPAAVQGLAMSEKLVCSGITALMGMGTTFVVLLFLWGCLSAMSRFMARSQTASLAAAGPGIFPAQNPPTAAASEHRTSEGLVSGGRTPAGNLASATASVYRTPASLGSTTRAGHPMPAAVIAAAVAAYETDTTNIMVRKIERLSGKPVWSYSVNERRLLK